MELGHFVDSPSVRYRELYVKRIVRVFHRLRHAEKLDNDKKIANGVEGPINSNSDVQEESCPTPDQTFGSLPEKPVHISTRSRPEVECTAGHTETKRKLSKEEWNKLNFTNLNPDNIISRGRRPSTDHHTTSYEKNFSAKKLPARPLT